MSLTPSHYGLVLPQSGQPDPTWAQLIVLNGGVTDIQKGHVVAYRDATNTADTTFTRVNICNEEGSSKVAGVASTAILVNAKGPIVLGGPIGYLKLHANVTHRSLLMAGSGIEIGHAILWDGTSGRAFAISQDDQGADTISTEAQALILPWRI